MSIGKIDFLRVPDKTCVHDIARCGNLEGNSFRGETDGFAEDLNCTLGHLHSESVYSLGIQNGFAVLLDRNSEAVGIVPHCPADMMAFQ